MNEITMKLNADRLIMQALEEDITSEDITTNAVMREKQMGEVQLLCKQDGVLAGLWVFERVFQLLDPETEAQRPGKSRTAGRHSKRRHPGAAFRGEDRTEFPSEDERDRYLYPPDRRAFKGQPDQAFGYQKDDA